jgi:hypothetical protein
MIYTSSMLYLSSKIYPLTPVSQPDGSQKAIQVMVFAESQRDMGEGHRPWDRPTARLVC